MANPPVDLARAAANVAAAAAKGPTGTQRSSIVPELSGQGTRLPGWSHFMPAERETAEAWQGRRRTETVQDMLNDSQVAALRQAIRLPTDRYVIALDPGDADPVTTELLAADLDVPVLGSEDEHRPGRRAGRFSERRHRGRVLDALDYGHAVFEQAGRLDEAGYWRLTDLAPVPQWTIDDQNSWEIDRHGNLVKVIQWGCNPKVEIPVAHLVTYTWQGAPGDPRGRSMLRPLYRSYVMRDRTMRVMGMSAERTGMGIPVGKVPLGSAVGAKQKMESLLAGLAAGHDTNLVFESDEDIHKSLMLMGVTGQTPDLVAMLRYHDDSMARAMLAMLLNLSQGGQGSLALGVEFDDLLSMFHDAAIDWYCDTTTQQLCEPWIDRNRGEDAPAPRLVWSRRPDGDEDEAPESPDLADVENPQAAQNSPAPVAARRRSRERGTAVAARRAQRQRRASLAISQPANERSAARASFAAIAGRDLRRDPSPVELAAAVDFATVEAQYVATQQSVAAALIAIRDNLTAIAVEQVAAMDTIDPLTLGDVLGPLLDAQARAQDDAPLVALLLALAAAGRDQVVGEAARQGSVFTADLDYGERAQADATDLMRRMARQVTESTAAAARTALAPGVSGQAAANVIAEHLGSLTSAAAEQAAAGASSRAQNAGRAAAIEAGPSVQIVATEILDASCCPSCVLIDGTEYASLDAALADYPAGGFKSCEGRERCRGLLAAIFEVDALDPERELIRMRASAPDVPPR